jgi:leucyl-tRNA---protein transferase
VLGEGLRMADLSAKFPRFFVTAPGPCPYIPGQVERKIFTELTGPTSAEHMESLGQVGFRRSQNVAYRPSCADCNACTPVRVNALTFSPSDSMRRIVKRNSDLHVYACEPWTTDEQFELLQRYLKARHPGGGMAHMDVYDYADMVERTPVDTLLYEYREPSDDDTKVGPLRAVCLTDRVSDGYSMVYSFYDPDSKRSGLGNYVIADHVLRAADAKLPYVYLGYYIAQSRKMAYKTRFRPMEILGMEGWAEVNPDEAELPF